jgi:hypothetical protein
LLIVPNISCTTSTWDDIKYLTRDVIVSGKLEIIVDVEKREVNMAKMTLHDALIILQITSIDNLSLTGFKRIKREKIKFLHPDRKQSLAEKEFFPQELAIANVALDIVEAELKRHQTQKK